MDRPLVSAILPVFNRAASLARAIDSVKAQTYARLELIVVDDGSDDATVAVLERHRGDATIVRQNNRGAYAARNRALRHARGELVAFIDSDDAWLPDRIERQVRLMRPGVGLVYGDVEIVSAPHDGAPRTGMTAFKAVPPRRGSVAEGFVHGNFVPTPSVLVRRAALEEIAGFSEESRISSDYLAWFRIATRHAFDFVDGPVALYTQHAAGISSNLGRSLEARIALFDAERERTADPATKAILDRLLFNLGLQMALAAARGRAGSIDRPFRQARAATAAMDRRRAFWSIAAFATNQIRMRAARLLS